MARDSRDPFYLAMKITLGVLGLLAIAATLLVFRQIFLAVAVALILAILLEPLIVFFRTRWRLRHGLSVALTALLLLTVVAAMAYGAWALISHQARHLSEQGPKIIEQLTQGAQRLADRFSWLGVQPDQLNVSGYLQQIGSGLLKMLSVSASGVTFVVVVLMLSLFIAADLRGYGRGVLTLFPPARRERIAELSDSSAATVRRWFFSHIIVLVISATLTAISMLAIGMDYWLVVAALTFVLDFIPFLGAIITGLIAALLTLGSEPEKVWWVLLAYVAIQQIETDVIIPVVMKGRIRLPEPHLLVFLLLMGAALGVIGVFLAPPVFAVLHHLYVQAYVPWIERRSARAAPA